MPKMKSHRGARKRFKITGSGKVKRMRAFKSHILTKKTPKRSPTGMPTISASPSRPTRTERSTGPSSSIGD